MNNWQYHDSKMLELKRIYNRISKQTQNRLQEIFDSIDFNFNSLYSITDNKKKQKINVYIETWKDKGLLKDYFGMLANSIYKRTRVKNSEILELLIYGAYIEEQSKLDEYEKQIMYDDTNYYYQQGQEEVNKTLKKKKQISALDMALFLYLLEQPNAKGYNWRQYTNSIIRYNAEQIYRQMTIDLQQQKEVLDITNDIYQNIIKRQGNSKLNINNDRISGYIDLTLIGLNNQAKLEGIKKKDNKAKVRFIGINDKKQTDMCKSLDGQEFYVQDWNIFRRYSKSSNKIKEYKCYGLVTGLNSPPINDGFHWCRSILTYQTDKTRKELNKMLNREDSIEKQEKAEYNLDIAKTSRDVKQKIQSDY